MQIVVPDEFQYLYVQDQEHPIVKIPADVLRGTARLVERVQKRHLLLADSMMREMRKVQGVGLAAPQVGVLESLIVIAPEGKALALFDPEVIESAGSAVMEEGCLSIPGLYGDVERPQSVVVRALDRKGRTCEYEMSGMPARVVQHEIDHLHGILFIDKADPATLHWIHPYGREDD